MRLRTLLSGFWLNRHTISPLKLFLLLSLIVFSITFIFPFSTLAVETQPTGLKALQKGAADVGREVLGQEFKDEEAARKQLVTTIGKIINGFLTFLGIVFVLLILYAGFLWMTAGGSADKVGQAKKILTNAIIGLVIIVSAYAIANFVIDVLVKATTK